MTVQLPHSGRGGHAPAPSVTLTPHHRNVPLVCGPKNLRYRPHLRVAALVNTQYSDACTPALHLRPTISLMVASST